MIKALKSLFILPEAETPEQLEHRLQVAAAALLIETARADFTQDASEEAALEQLLCNALSLPSQEVRALITAASERVDEATSLYEFTRVINDHYGPEEKLTLIASMWQVAYADGDLDKYEEHLIRQVAELTYVPHQDYIRCKLDARKS
ncbi:TerB family tellurite resistance protein [Haliea salexigens]|jgi:uncharacterized tellurite resistance protein B-like protein|uniref:tellurite resistance TerB family protein n=1 Tax=Haliea salexigens TaxID=287487 RepID=UPI000412A74D|nr:TerB family tellurite resistance protein [Haliea salexigens]|tara:strand:+ start:44144 stop:44587 length:444 start_codon:yes stop_codon:yes gene_type:complete